jgi:hypothetical protein
MTLTSVKLLYKSSDNQPNRVSMEGMRKRREKQ